MEIESLRQELADLRMEVRALSATNMDRTPTGEPASNADPSGEPGSVNEQVITGLKQILGQERNAVAICFGGVYQESGSISISVLSSGPVRAEGDAREASRVLSVLASDVRLRLLQFLWHGERTTQELIAGVGVTGGTLYHHMRELYSLRWVDAPQRNRYTLTPQGRFAVVGALSFSGYLGGIEEAAGELPQPEVDV